MMNNKKAALAAFIIIYYYLFEHLQNYQKNIYYEKNKKLYRKHLL